MNEDNTLLIIYALLGVVLTILLIGMARAIRRHRDLTSAGAKLTAEIEGRAVGMCILLPNLNECIAAGDWTLFYSLEEATKKVTTADIQRVANEYLNVDQSTTGWFVPIQAGAGAPKAPGAAAKLFNEAIGDGPYYYRTPGVAYGPLPATKSSSENPGAATSTGRPAPTHIAAKAVRSKIAGIDLIAYPTGVKNVVTLRGGFPAGTVFAGRGNAAVPKLTGMLLDEGTTRQDKFAIATKLESVGATISFSVGAQMVEIDAKCLKEDVPLVVSLIAEQLRFPALAAEELEKMKKQYAGSLQRQLEDTNFRAGDAFSRAVFPVGHPNRDPAPDELLAAIEAAKLDDIVAFHKKHYGPAHLTLVATGDLDLATLQREVEKSFAGWSGGVALPQPPKATSTNSPKSVDLAMPGKTSASVVLGQASGLRYRDPDYQAVRLATAILGSGFTGRLMANVRDKEGLTYGIGSYLFGDTFTDGAWQISASFAPALLDKGITSTKRQLMSWYEEGVTTEEVERAKSRLIGSFEVGLATSSGMANNLLATVNRGYDLGWLDRFAPTLAAITTDQVNHAVKKHLRPDELYLVRAGTFGGVEAKK